LLRIITLACLTLAAIACASSGEGGRPVAVNQNDNDCTPSVIDATPGEKLDLQVSNNTGKDYEVEGIDGTQLEEVIVPGGRDRSVGFSVPDEGGTFKIKCYIPGGTSTIIEVRAGGGGAQTEGPSNSATDDAASDTTVEVDLTEWTVTPDVETVEAGSIKFVASNDSRSMIHELAVLRVKDDGSFENLGEVEDIDPGESGSVVIEMDSGRYQLACVIVPGEAGSTTDHYEQGMHTEFTVE
jgi:uncharacterized cupredoxin-like copper-binding protein